MTPSRGLRNPKGTRQTWLAAQPPHMCGCGCGEQIPLKVEHFNIGIPEFVHGHNSRAGRGRKRAVPLVSQPCACGCGSMTTPGKQFLSGHNGRGQQRSEETRAKISRAMSGTRNHRKGKRPPNFRGVTRTDQGYVMLHRPDHPMAHKGHKTMMEHRLVMEAHLRATDPGSPHLIELDGEMYLAPWVEVHHINGVKDDNRIENLEPLTKADHARLHGQDRPAPTPVTHCKHGHEFTVENTQITPDGRRMCKECRRRRNREQAARRKAARQAQKG